MKMNVWKGPGYHNRLNVLFMRYVYVSMGKLLPKESGFFQLQPADKTQSTKNSVIGQIASLQYF